MTSLINVFIIQFLIGFIKSLYRSHPLYTAIIDGSIHVIIGSIVFYITPLHVEYVIILEIFTYHVENMQGINTII